jgi:hypothetical protein
MNERSRSSEGMLYSETRETRGDALLTTARHLLPHYRNLMAKWRLATERQLARIEQDRATVSDAMRREALVPKGTAATGAWKELNVDVHFLLIAVRHIVRLAQRIRDMAKEEAPTAVRDELIAALSRFNSQHLEAKMMRDLLEHFDAYAEGAGDLRTRLDQDDLAWGPADGTLADLRQGGLLLLKGGLQLNVQDVGQGALDLADDVVNAIQVDEPWRQLWPES